MCLNARKAILQRESNVLYSITQSTLPFGHDGRRLQIMLHNYYSNIIETQHFGFTHVWAEFITETMLSTFFLRFFPRLRGGTTSNVFTRKPGW